MVSLHLACIVYELDYGVPWVLSVTLTITN